MARFRVAAGYLAAASLGLVLTGCVTRGPVIPQLAATRPAAVELTGTPFFPQLIHQCGPAALATALVASGVDVGPQELESVVYLPEKRGSLQIEMGAAPRRYGRLTHVLEPGLEAILDELDAGRPVVVLHNYGVPFLPRWHYAVVVGYDPTQDTIVLRSGKTRRLVLSARNFMRAWDNGGRWAMGVLRPGEMPRSPDRKRYLEAAAAFERLAKPRDSLLVFDAATRQWPEEPIALIGRGTAHYRLGELPEAANNYAAALRADPAQAGARNNLAMALIELSCLKEARVELDGIAMEGLAEPLRDAVIDTRARLESREREQGLASCRLPPADLRRVTTAAHSGA